MIKSLRLLVSLTGIIVITACSSLKLTQKNDINGLLTKTPLISTADAVGCIQLPTKNFDENPVVGNLAFLDDIGLIIMNLQTGVSTQLYSADEIDYDGIVSPDGKWVAYKQTTWKNSDPQNILSQLVILSVDGSIKKQLEWGKSWDTLGYWMDNQHLIVKLNRIPPSTLSSLFVIDVFTNNTTVVNPSFPQIEDLTRIDWDNSSKTIYDQSLSMVFYPSLEGDGHKYILWDIRGSRVIAKLPTRDFSVDGPQWSPDRKEIIVDATGDTSLIGKNEFFSINKNGTINQISSFGKQYTSIELRKWSWSSDSNNIAFWYRPSLGSTQKYSLGVLDVSTGEWRSYCIEMEMANDLLEPIWLPDGHHIVVGSDIRDSEGQDLKIYLLDIEKGLKVQIGKNIRPLGWMK